MNKKSMFFTYTAVLMVSVMVLAFTTETYVTLKSRIPVIKQRVQLANNYVGNIKNIYLRRALYATGYRALYAMANDTTENGFFTNKENFEENFRTAILEAKIRGSESNIMKGKTIIDTLNLLENLSYDAYHINTTFEKDIDKIDITIFQDNLTGPWQVGVNMSISYFVDAGLAEWNVSELIQAVFSITDLDDPMYLVETNGEFTNRINQTPFETWGIDNLKAHIINRTYKYDATAPSFLMRFYDDTSASLCCGIESLISEDVLNQRETGNSFVDCAYWGGACGSGSLYNLTGFEDIYSKPLTLDAYHVNVYNVTEYVS